MRIVADEGVDQPIVEALRADGHEVFSIREESPGLHDQKVLRAAIDQEAVLFTTDKDFGELVHRQKKAHSGIVLLRILGLSTEKKKDLVINNIRQHQHEVTGAFTVLTPQIIRIRKE